MLKVAKVSISLLLVALIILATATGGGIYYYQTQKTSDSIRDTLDETNVQELEGVKIANYQLATSLPQDYPAKVPVYKVADFSENYFKTIASKFGTVSKEQVIGGRVFEASNIVSFDNLETSDGKTPFTLQGNLKTGEWHLLLPSSLGKGNDCNLGIVGRQELVQNGQRILTSLGLWENLLEEAGTYSFKNSPYFCAVDFRRNHSSLPIPLDKPVSLTESRTIPDRLPFLDPIGLLHQNLNSPERRLPNQNIILSSEKRLGEVADTSSFARSNDGNSITLIFRSDDRVASIASTLKPIEKTVGSYSVISPEAALEKIRAGTTEAFQLVVPSGEGEIDINKVFAQKELISLQNAIIDGITLAYVEPSTSIVEILGKNPQYFQPAWIFQGKATLPNGDQGKFVVALPAITNFPAKLLADVKKPLLEKRKIIGEESLVSTKETLQLEAVEPLQCPEEPPAPTDGPRIVSKEGCAWRASATEPSKEDVDKTLSQQTLNSPTLGLTQEEKVSATQALGSVTIPYCPPSPSTTSGQTVPSDSGEGGPLWPLFLGPLMPLVALILLPLTVTCIIPLTPATYFYPETSQTIDYTIESKLGNLVYINPASETGLGDKVTLKFEAKPGGRLIDKNGQKFHQVHYYYLHNHAPFSPQDGFVVEGKNTLEFMEKEFLPKLNLTDLEQKELLYSIKASLSYKPLPPFYQISLMPQASMDQYLPMKISPQPEIIIRNFVYLKPLDTKIELPPPNLPSIERKGYVVVENGALFDK